VAYLSDAVEVASSLLLEERRERPVQLNCVLVRACTYVHLYIRGSVCVHISTFYVYVCMYVIAAAGGAQGAARAAQLRAGACM
jgi:hypothetical protein